MDLCRGPVGTIGSIEFKAQSSNDPVEFPLSHSPTTAKQALLLPQDTSAKSKRKLDMSPHGSGSTSHTPLSVSMSSSGDHLSSGKGETSSTTNVTPRPVICVAGAGSGEYRAVTSLDVGGTSTVQGGGGVGVHNDVGDTKEDEDTVKATWTRETIDSVEPRGADGNQPHLLSRADWSTSLLTVLSRARELGHSIGMDAADIAQLGAQIVESQSGKIIHDAQLLQMFGKLAKESKAAALQRKSPGQALQAQLSVVVGAGGERKEGLAYSCAEAQIEELSDTPCSLALPEKALMVVGPTEKGDSMATLDIWCQIVRDKGVDRNETWKNPRFATLPSNSKLFFIFDTTVEAEEALIQVRRVIQEQFLGPQDAGASAILIHPATLQARGIDTSVLRSYSTGATNEEAQLRCMTEAFGFKHANIKPNDPFGEEVAAFATQNQQATNKEESDKIAHKDKEDADALDQQTRESKKIDEDKAVQEKKKQFKIKVHKEKIQAIDDGIKTSQKLLDEVQAYGSVTNLDADDLETIRQCELSIADFQRQKDVCLTVMNAQSPAVIYNEVPEEVASDEVVEERAPPPTTRNKDQHKKIPVLVKRHL